MALTDFKQYFYSIQSQYLEMKNDLADFTKALQDGYITEDQLATAKNDVFLIEQNYQRLAYIAFLLELPARKRKKAKYKNINKRVVQLLQKQKADDQSVFDENKSVLDHLRAELKKLKDSK